MSKSYVTLKASLVTALQAINGEGGSPLFTSVVTVEETNPDGYPYAVVSESAGEGQILDTARNEREWQFEIHIIHEQGKKSDVDTSASVIDAVDRVLTTFDKNPTFKDDSGVAQAKQIRVIPVDFEFGSRETPMSRAILRMSVVDTVNRFT